MSSILFMFIILNSFLCYFLQVNAVLPIKITPGVEGETSKRCSSRSNSDLLLNYYEVKYQQVITDALDLVVDHLDSTPPQCNGIGWTRVTFLNMSDPNEVCPSTLSLITTPVRGCGRTTGSLLSCDSVRYNPGINNYSEVCGRILAYQRGGTTAFVYSVSNIYNSIDQAYVDGVSLTYGPAGRRQHIWTFASALYDQDPHYRSDWNCPCTNTGYNWPYTLPSFIKNNYFCDTGNSGPGYSPNTFYSSDLLWDGEGCGSSSTCCHFNSPPWFNRVLPVSTSDDIELRLCHGDSRSDQDIAITVIEIYVK